MMQERGKLLHLSLEPKDAGGADRGQFIPVIHVIHRLDQMVVALRDSHSMTASQVQADDEMARNRNQINGLQRIEGCWCREETAPDDTGTPPRKPTRSDRESGKGGNETDRRSTWLDCLGMSGDGSSGRRDGFGHDARQDGQIAKRMATWAAQGDCR